jgi:hypothetical protein
MKFAVYFRVEAEGDTVELAIVGARQDVSFSPLSLPVWKVVPIPPSLREGEEPE